MRFSASRRSWSFLVRLCLGLSVIVVGSSAASSCITKDFEFGADGAGGEGPLYPSHCSNRAQDEDESDRDCGGSCEPCPIGAKCETIRDCEAPPVDDPAILLCLDGVCRLDCPTDFGDCDSRASNGCEANFLSDIEHCGTCSAECDPPHAQALCMNGECGIDLEAENLGCDPNFANCNLRVEDGCEVDLRTDVDHCGACEDSACSMENGEPSCFSRQCSISCNENYADCDEKAENGCEAETLVSVRHCGGCGQPCPTQGPEYAAFCKEGVCGETLCEIGKGDCDGDGECSDSLLSAKHCGECGESCTAANAVPGCEDIDGEAVCVIDSCQETEDGRWADCDDDFVTGCEVNTTLNKENCGGCGPERGGDGENCTEKEGEQHVTVSSCMLGECQVAGCDGGYVDCDGEFDNGCEVNTNTDEDNCGGCDDACAQKAHTSGQCVGGSCDYSCESGWADRNNDRYDERSDGCETRRIAKVGTAAWGSSETGGSGPPVNLTHTLVGAGGSQRLVLVGVICRGNSEANCELTTATYDGEPLLPVVETFLQDTSTKIFYLPDDRLPETAGEYQVVLDRNDDWGSLAAEVFQVTGADPSDPFLRVLSASDNDNCGVDPDATVEFTDLPAGTFVYAVSGGAQGNSSAGTLLVEDPLVVSHSGGGSFIVFGSAYAAEQVDDLTVHLDVSSCYRSVLQAVALRAYAP